MVGRCGVALAGAGAVMTDEEKQREENLAAMRFEVNAKRTRLEWKGFIAGLPDVKFEGRGVVKRAGKIIQQSEEK